MTDRVDQEVLRELARDLAQAQATLAHHASVEREVLWLRAENLRLAARVAELEEERRCRQS